MNLLEKIGCKYVSAIYTGDREKDNNANTELYLKLVKEGEEKGFCPVLVDKDIQHYIQASQYGFTDKKEDYPKITKRIIELVEDNCFNVWLGRLIYNYYLDGEQCEDDVKRDLEMLKPPASKEYLERFSDTINVQNFVFGRNDAYKPYPFTYKDHVFALLPVIHPWEILAWIPMGGFNWCPDELHQIALAKGLNEQFGARIMYISGSALEYYIPTPLIKKEDVERAAKILIAADNDIYEDYEVAADKIMGSPVWYMWWD